MKKLLSKLKKWKVKLFGRSSNALNSNQIETSHEAEEKWVGQPYIVPAEFYLTQSGQLIRQPVTRKKYYKAHRSKKRTK